MKRAPAKPCPDKQKPIAWLTLEALDAPAAQELRAHLQTCVGCRGYLAELAQVTKQLAAQPKAGQASVELSASETFHRQVMARLHAEKPAATSFSVGRNIMTAWRNGVFRWQAVLPAGLAAAIILAVWVQRPAPVPPPHHVSRPVPIHAPAAASTADDNLMPTLANYRQAAGQSLEKLDELLARQPKPAASAMPVYTAAADALGI